MSTLLPANSIIMRSSFCLDWWTLGDHTRTHTHTACAHLSPSLHAVNNTVDFGKSTIAGSARATMDASTSSATSTLKTRDRNADVHRTVDLNFKVYVLYFFEFLKLRLGPIPHAHARARHCHPPHSHSRPCCPPLLLLQRRPLPVALCDDRHDRTRLLRCADHALLWRNECLHLTPLLKGKRSKKGEGGEGGERTTECKKFEFSNALNNNVK